MRIGLFTDTYHPSINGIVYVVDSIRRHLEAAGHEVYVFCPARSIRPSEGDDDHVVRFRSVKGAFYDDYDTSLFFPPRELARIKKLELDVIHFFTPGQIGLMGIYAAHKTGVVLVAQHCTDLYEYSQHYKAVLPGLLALITLLPLSVKVDLGDIRELMKLYRPRKGAALWNQEIIEKAVTMAYKKCDAVIALSRKSKHQLLSWQRDDRYAYHVTLMPNGVDPIPAASPEAIAEFRRTWGIEENDEVIGFVGRLGAEKNLPLLIEVIEHVRQSRPQVKLLFVGDFEFRETLEKMAAESSAHEAIIFTGALPREQLGVAYGAMTLFAFPSLTDTQSWVLHEAAHAGLPIVLIDQELSEVVVDGENGRFVPNDASGFAKIVGELLADKSLLKQYGDRSRELAGRYLEASQVEKLQALYREALRSHR